MPFSPPPTPPSSPRNAFNNLSMEERWTRHLRNRQNMIAGVGTSATVEQQNWYHEQFQSQSTATQHPPSLVPAWSQLRKLLDGKTPPGVMGFLGKHATEHESSEYHGPEAYPYRYSEQRNRFGFIGSPSPPLDRSDSLSSIETIELTDEASSYTYHVEDNRPVNNLGWGISNAHGQLREFSFYKLMKKVARKAYAFFITTTDAATQTTPFNNNAHSYTDVISGPDMSIDGIQANTNGHTSGAVLAGREGVGENVGVSTRAPNGHIRWSDIETTRSMTENLAAIRQGNNNNGKKTIPVACPAFSVPNHLATVDEDMSTSSIADIEPSSPLTSHSGAENTSPTRTPAHTRASSLTREPSTNPTSGTYVPYLNLVTNNRRQLPTSPLSVSTEALLNEASTDPRSEARTSGSDEEDIPTGADTSTLEQQPQSEGVTDGISDNRVLPAPWTPASHGTPPFERELDRAMVPGLHPRPGPAFHPPGYQPGS